MCLCPLQFAGLSLHLEILVAFGAAKAEEFGIVADEGDAFGGVDGTRAEVARFDSGSISHGHREHWGAANLMMGLCCDGEAYTGRQQCR